jgi:hypothetical protein
MRKISKTIVFTTLLTTVFYSCHNKDGCSKNNDIAIYLNFYNTTRWVPYLEKRNPRDKALQKKLLELSVLFGDLARDAIDASGGFKLDGSLMNGCTEVKLEDKEIKRFYSEVKAIVQSIGDEEKNSGVYKELNRIIEYSLFNEKGGLHINSIRNGKIETIAPRLLFYENLCYYLIIKYA